MTVKKSFSEKKKIKKILIANRGEIAVRIINTCKKLKIKTIAIYSEIDSLEKFVKIADESYPLGGNLPRESYLDTEKVINIAKKSNCDAIHPGYGFLSEKADFAKAVNDAGFIFIGPSYKSINLMGDKISAKKIATEAKVPVVPGYVGEIENEEQKESIIKNIGFPLIIKASAGGGGKGMRIVYHKEEFEAAFSACVSEAKKNFNDGRVFIEKFIEDPRHIEIQILADKFGNTVCLGERECSVQRLNQKIIEESPSTFIDEETRKGMYDVSSGLAIKCGYYSVGTIEYIVDKDKNFYFLEMNTRLQVEHPVTEYVTGLDLVEEMIKVASGEKLTIKQSDVLLKGWSIECRICAEDTEKNFTPSTGRIISYIEPKKSKNVRIESGCSQGTTISPFYDAMIAKLITHSDSREEAIMLLKQALSQYEINGITTNIPMLEGILRNNSFTSGDISTAFIQKHYPDGFKGSNITDDIIESFVLSAAFLYIKKQKELSKIKDNRRNLVQDNMNILDDNRLLVFIDKDNKFTVSYKAMSKQDNDYCTIKYGKKSSDVTVYKDNQNSNIFVYKTREKRENIRIINKNGSFSFVMSLKGVEKNVRVIPSHLEQSLEHILNKKVSHKIIKKLQSPITGLITSINVKEGDSVSAGTSLLLIEAMKMENVINVNQDVIIKEIKVKEGDSVNVDQVLMTFDNKTTK